MPNWDFDKFGLVFRKNQPRLMAERCHDGMVFITSCKLIFLEW